MSDDRQNGSGLLTPGVAADRLGISGAALRRMAKAYVEVYGELPEGASGRLWPNEAIERLHDARTLMTAGRAKSVRDGLEALRDGAQVSVEAPAALSRDAQVLEVIARRLEGVERLEREVEALRREVGELRALPNVKVGPISSAQVVEPQRAEQSEWVKEVSRHGAGLGVRRPINGGTEDGLLVRMARRLERLLRRSDN